MLSINYYQRKDLGIYTILNNNDCSLKTFGGNVMVTVYNTTLNNPMLTLEEAINQNLISIDTILAQANEDAKYGICPIVGFCNDGGSKEYIYNDYTILKLKTLSGDKDLVIGMQGSILNMYNKCK